MLELLQNISWVIIIQIILIDLLLSADNAVLISLACRKLPASHRFQGIVWGTVGAIALRVALIGVALNLLLVPGLKIVAGLLLLWIAMRLLTQAEPDHTRIAGGVSLLAAIKTIIVADFLMSLDNVLAISGATAAGMPTGMPAHQLGLVIIALVVSVPLVILMSSVLIKLMQRMPIVVLLGIGLLGWVAGGLVVTDMLVVDQFGASHGLVKLGVQVAGAVVAMVLARYWAATHARQA